METRADWPLVVENDDGIRPAGEPDACFYCRQKIGQPHRLECVIVEKKVKVRYVFDIEISVPYSWDTNSIEFHRNDSSWCADNALNDLKSFGEANGCLCSAMTCEFIETVDKTPTRKVRISK